MIPIQKWHRRAQVGQKRAKNQSPFHTNTPLWRMHLPLSLIFCAARVFWCDWKQILTRCSYKKLWKPTASTLSLRHGRTTKTERTAKPSWGPPWHLYQLRSTWQWAALEVEAQQAACFLQYCSMSNVTEYVTYLLNNIILIIKIFLANEWTDLLGFAGGSAGHRGRG